jgi:hypothetical protein
MAIKSLHQFFYYHSKYLNRMKCQEISMGPSIRTIQCRTIKSKTTCVTKVEEMYMWQWRNEHKYLEKE